MYLLLLLLIHYTMFVLINRDKLKNYVPSLSLNLSSLCFEGTVDASPKLGRGGQDGCGPNANIKAWPSLLLFFYDRKLKKNESGM